MCAVFFCEQHLPASRYGDSECPVCLGMYVDVIHRDTWEFSTTVGVSRTNRVKPGIHSSDDTRNSKLFTAVFQ